jgi:hypothetical protein
MSRTHNTRQQVSKPDRIKLINDSERYVDLLRYANCYCQITEREIKT